MKRRIAKRNYIRIYRAISKAARHGDPMLRLRAVRVAAEENWSCTPFVYRKIEAAMHIGRGKETW